MSLLISYTLIHLYLACPYVTTFHQPCTDTTGMKCLGQHWVWIMKYSKSYLCFLLGFNFNSRFEDLSAVFTWTFCDSDYDHNFFHLAVALGRNGLTFYIEKYVFIFTFLSAVRICELTPTFHTSDLHFTCQTGTTFQKHQ